MLFPGVLLRQDQLSGGRGTHWVQEDDSMTRCGLRRSLSVAVTLSLIPAALHAQETRVTNDVSGGYISTYTLATGTPYSDPVLVECSRARGRQNEPAVALD